MALVHPASPNRSSPRILSVQEGNIHSTKILIYLLNLKYRVQSIKKKFPVSEPPEAPEKPQIDDITAHSMLVTWNEPNDNGSPIVGYWVERREINSSRWTRVNR